MKGPLIFVILVSLALLSKGQDRKAVDSLEANYASLSGVAKAAALYELVYFYLRVDNAIAKKYFDECRLSSLKEQSPASLAYMLMAQGIYYNRNGLLDSAVTMLEQARINAESAKANRPLIRIHSALAHTFISSGKAEKGLEHLFAGLRVVADHPDKEMEMKLRTNIPWAYLELKQYRNCIDAGLENLKTIEGTPFEWIALYTYNNVAVSYGALGQLDSAEYFIGKGIASALKSNDNQSLANGYFILGTIYSNAGKHEAAIQQYLKARPFREKVGNPLFLAADLYTISDLYFKTGDYRKGIEAGKEALAIAEQYHLNLKLESTYLSLARNYEGIGDFRNASNYYRMYASAKDTLYKEASAEAIAEMQTKYDTEKKERLLAEQRAELFEQRSRIQGTYFIIGGLVAALAVVVAIFLIMKARTRRKHELKAKEQELLLREAQIHATIHSQESERKRFAQDLHDGMGQLISALRLALQGVKRDTPIEDRVEVVSKGENILNEMHHEIRSIAFNLMPQTLVQHGLVPALKEMSDRMNGSGKVIVRIGSFDFPSRLSELEEISLYRVVQEWINNVIKYAGSALIQVQLVGHEEELAITIEDDGRGFDVSTLYNGKGNGWKNIQSRLNLIGASIDIDSTPGMSGTTVTIRVPVAREKKRMIEELTVVVPTPATVGPNTH
jgi:two-component system, NarL family, sensor kinase